MYHGAFRGISPKKKRKVNFQISAYLRRLTTAQPRYMLADELQIILVEMFLFTGA
jgi:hypothetical protein